jgi:hypothetical protein
MRLLRLTLFLCHYRRNGIHHQILPGHRESIVEGECTNSDAYALEARSAYTGS